MSKRKGNKPNNDNATGTDASSSNMAVDTASAPSIIPTMADLAMVDDAASYPARLADNKGTTADLVRMAIAASAPKPTLTVLPTGATALPNNMRTGSVLTPIPTGAAITSFGVACHAIEVANGVGTNSYQTCRSTHPQWPNMGAGGSAHGICVVLHPCTTGNGSAMLMAGHVTKEGEQCTKLYPYGPRQITVAVSQGDVAMLQDLASAKGASDSLVALVAMLVAIPAEGS
jgi:hypothetical protein